MKRNEELELQAVSLQRQYETERSEAEKQLTEKTTTIEELQ